MHAAPRRLLHWGLLLGLCVSPLADSAERAPSISILLLDGNSGKPMIGVNLFINPDCGQACLFPDNRISWTTDGAGEIELPAMPNLRKLRLMKPTSYFMYCQESENHNVNIVNPDAFVADDILRTGVKAPNNCNRRIRVQARPGQLIFFLRNLTWWEQLTKGPQM
jgi:hypothetical protein